MSLLKEGIEKGYVEKTELVKKLTVGGKTEAYPVYRVQLDQLYYNDQNDRIATWISEYKSDGGDFDFSAREECNKIIEKFICESNPDMLKRTKKNIELLGQREPGVTLDDGRVVDGNRRFTCLRQLNRDDSRAFGWFETVILTESMKHNAKQIKMLELMLQLGTEKPVDYSPIDRLVGIYNDLIENKLLTVKEYADSINETEKRVEQLQRLAVLMTEFLEFIKAPKQFHLARKLNIYALLEDLQKFIDKHPRIDTERAKTIVFTNILFRPTEEMNRYVRNMIKIMESKFADEYMATQEEIAVEVQDLLPSGRVTNLEDIGRIKNVKKEDTDITWGDAARKSTEETFEDLKRNNAQNQPAELLKEANRLIEKIDMDVVKRLNEEQKKELVDKLAETEALLANIKDALHVH